MRRTPLPVEQVCEICGTYTLCARHHIYYGTANRKKSEQWGLVASLCPACHNSSPMAVHFNRSIDLMLKRRYQEKFEQEHSRELFIREFGRSYL